MYFYYRFISAILLTDRKLIRRCFMANMKNKKTLEERDVEEMIQEYWETLESLPNLQGKPTSKPPIKKAVRLKARL